MKWWVRLAAVFLLLLAGARPALAAWQEQAGPLEDPEFSSVTVDVWPEYDRAELLVIYHFTLSEQVPLPAELTVRIPAAAGAPHAVAMQDPNGLFSMSYQSRTVGEWLELSFDVTTQDFQIEYYDPQIDITSSRRGFVYRWPSDYTVENLVINIQQPVGASGMRISPDVGSGRVANDGLTYFTSVVGQVRQGTRFSYQVEYEKSGNELTNPPESALPVQAQGPLNQQAGPWDNVTTALPWALGILGGVLLGLGAWWYWQINRRPAEKNRKHKNRGDAEPDGAYCHQCGRRAGAGDVFCRSCGSRLRDS